MANKKKSEVEHNRFHGYIEPMGLASEKKFYFVVVEGSATPPTVKHENYDDALNEAVRLSKHLNKVAYVVEAVTKISPVTHVHQY